GASQVTAVPGIHAAPLQWSPAVHASPSLHAEPSGFGAQPAPGSHVWHCPGHLRGAPDTHAPLPSQRSSTVQAFPSSQSVPAGWSVQPTGSHSVTGALGASLPRVTMMVPAAEQSMGIWKTSIVGVTAWTSASIAMPPSVTVTRLPRPIAWFWSTISGLAGEQGSPGRPTGSPGRSGSPKLGVDAVHAAPSMALKAPPFPLRLSLWTPPKSPARGRAGTTRAIAGGGPPPGPVGF